MKRSLKLSFDRPDDLVREWTSNLSVGGAIVPSDEAWEVRELVRFEIAFGFMDGSESFDAEVVFADPSGKVMVQLNHPPAEVRARIEPWLERAEQGSPAPAAERSASPAARVETEELSEAPAPGESLLAFDIDSPADDDPFDRSAFDLSEPDETDLAGLDIDGIDLDNLSDLSEGEAGAFDAAHLDSGSAANAAALPGPGEFEEGDFAAAAPDELLADAPPQAFAEMRDLEALDGGAAFDADFADDELEAEAYETGEFALSEDMPLSDPDPDPEAGAIAELDAASDLALESTPALPPDVEIVSGDDFTDRRGAIREQARVPVRVDANNVSFEGRTRDLSDTGVLISVDGSELPVGKQVMISLSHPDTGEAIEVPGTVKRHIDGQGTVAAVGVEIEGSQLEMQRFETLVHNIQQVELERRASGISGVIEELGMPSLLQMLCQSSDRGTVTVTDGSEEGTIAFESGVLRYSRIGNLRGPKAFSRMLGWKTGHFQFVGQVDALAKEDEPLSLEAALLDALRQQDEAAHRPQASLDPSTVLSVDMEALAREGASLDKTQEAVVDLAAAGFTVRRVLDIIPESDAAVLASIQELRELGIVKI